MSSSLHLSKIRKWLLQSPPIEWGIQQLRELLLGAVRQGPVPQHIAFVMDGNRRFARTHQIETIEGHNLGFEALAKILEVCYKSGVRVVTIYAFSIENFKRSKYEVGALMDMAKVKLSQLAQHGELLDRYGAKIQFLGQKEMVRPDVLEAIEKAIELTSGNGKAILNICAPYTSRDEITSAIRNTVIDYTKPIAPSLKRPFSETHITRNIRAQSLNTTAQDDDKEALLAAAAAASPPVPTSHDDDASPSPDPSAAPDGPADPTDEPSELSQSSTLNPSPAASHTGPTSPSPSSSPPLPPHHDHDHDQDQKPHHHHLPPPPPNYPDVETITAATLTEHMFTAGSPPLDLLIRTSGVERLSDFMLWQCHQDTSIVFLECMWPEFDLWHFLPVLVEWQWRRRKGEEGVGVRRRERERVE